MAIGGYLPLELPRGKEFHNVKKEYIKRFNSGRAAIYDVLLFLVPPTVWLPHYICDSVIAMIKKSGCHYERYFINEDFTIKNREDLNIKENDCIILVNYFGLMEENLKADAEYFAGVNIIIDNTQAFFAKPLFKEKVFNIYSARKFIGTSDGAYLIAEDLPNYQYEKDYSSDAALFLMTSMERGTEYSYEESKENEERLYVPKEMSELTERILQAADYRFIQKQRQENYRKLNELLGVQNEIKLFLKEQVPYCYPFLIQEDIRKALVSEKIYIPVLWQELMTPQYADTREQQLSKYMLCLPIDQRYSGKEMSKIAESIQKKVN